jgi:hypothetical protein
MAKLSGFIGWALVLLIDLVLFFGPVVMIMLSKETTRKVKLKWSLYWISTIILLPILLGVIANVADLSEATKYFSLLLLVPVSFISGWVILFIFNQKYKPIP